MCGFVGTTNKHLCSLMLQKQESRGPDGCHYWADGSMAFGHALLDITGNAQLQPFITPKGNILLFNGEIYDSAESNDTKWLGAMLDKYGVQPLTEIDWHGAIAYYEPRKKQVTLVRDQFGTKPLWWRYDGKHFEFSTSLKSFQNKKMKPDSHTARYIKNSQYFGDECVWQHIHKVAPGQTMIFSTEKRGAIKKDTNLWNFFIRRKPKEKEGWLEEFRDLTKKQILKVINHGADNKTALFLSGGLDSNLIAAIAKESNKEVVLYTCGYALQKGDVADHDFFRNESQMAMQTAEKLGMSIVKVDLDRDDRVQYGKMWTSETHFPWSDHNRQAPRYLMAKAAASHDCKVVITGDSGDELFTGYLHHEKRFDQKWLEDHTEYMIKTKWFPHKAFTDDLQYNSFFSDLLHTSEQNVLAIDQTAGMFGMEARVPLLTQRYAHHIMNMPTEIRFKQIEGFAPGTTKYLARVGLANFIPDHITSRKSKVGWSSPWDNNVNDVADRWRLRDLELLRRIG